ncbi:MAG TPA: DUF1003 domain-containing protein [Sporichthyaceae bacterium]|jgi:uncharacterized membrane protein|nr:DUF1003 domain-containing protein [Sporichthyaceae bacterium]
MSTAESSGRRGDSLGSPIGPRFRRPQIDADTFGAISEDIARFFGTARYLFIQTALVIVWISINVTWAATRFDAYPFILLNLAFSTQAAYAAPLILLAQNRQADRDRVQIARDREIEERQRATTDYLAVELADLRSAQNDAATRDYIDRALERFRKELLTELRDIAARDEDKD